MYQLLGATPVVTEPIEFATDFEPEMIGCDRYEQFVELVS